MSAPPASTLRETFTFICTALTEIGLSDLTPEVLRQATQEAYAVRQSLTNCSNETVNVTFIVAQSCQLLKNVHSLLVLALAQFPQNPRPQLKRYWEQVACEHVCSNVPATGLHFICSQLLEKGYPRASVLASSADCSGREMLLALGWLLVETNALQHALDRQLQRFRVTAMIPPYPQDGLEAEAAGRDALHSSLLARQHVQQVLQVCADQQDWNQVQVTTQHALMLQSKCKAKARRLQALHQSHSKLTHTVQQLHMDKQQLQHMQSNKKSSSLTPYEWSLLQSGDKMRRHEESLVAAAYMADACRQAQLHAAAFFHWLSSLHEQDRPVGGAACQTWMEPGLHGHVSLAALPELQCIAPSLQAKLHAAMQTITKSAKPVPACHKGSGARPALCQIQHEIACLADAAAAASGTDISIPDLPTDIQQRIDAVKQKQQTAQMPWQGFQLDTATLVQNKLTTSLPSSNTSADASGEIDRLTQVVLHKAKALARTRASHKRQLEQVAVLLRSDSHTVVQL